MLAVLLPDGSTTLCCGLSLAAQASSVREGSQLVLESGGVGERR